MLWHCQHHVLGLRAAGRWAAGEKLLWMGESNLGSTTRRCLNLRMLVSSPTGLSSLSTVVDADIYFFAIMDDWFDRQCHLSCLGPMAGRDVAREAAPGGQMHLMQAQDVSNAWHRDGCFS